MYTFELRNLLEKADDKFSTLTNSNLLNDDDISIFGLVDLINEFLTDQEKVKLFNYPQFNQLIPEYEKTKIIRSISDEKIILQILTNENVLNSFTNFEIIDTINPLSDNIKENILNNHDFIEKRQFNAFDLYGIILSLTDKTREKLLLNSNLIKNELNLSDYEITKLIKSLSDDNLKDQLIEQYNIHNYNKFDILQTCSNSHKIDALLMENDLFKSDIIGLLQTLDIQSLSSFLLDHKDFFIANNLYPYEIISVLNSEQQKYFVLNLECLNLTLTEKREILATLKEDVKQSISTTNFPEEYKSALDIKTMNGFIVFDFEKDLDNNIESFKGLDHLIRINPEEFTKEQRDKFMKMCNICPNLIVENSLNKSRIVTYFSTGSEYIEAENWISSIIDNLDPKYSKAQQLAIIDNAIGKKISYSPDFNTEIFDVDDCRALWKIVSSGYGVCNGISNLEKYILDRVGIDSEIVESEHHAFLKIKNIEFPLANGKIVKGNTILDPTWNLSFHRFGGRPDFFCINYEQARKNDIDRNGSDSYCHENDEKLQDATLNLDDESLRHLFASVNLADKNGNFPIINLLEKSELIDKIYANDPKQNINTQFLLLSKFCPEFATCQDSSISIISDVLLDNEHLNFNKCVVHRVYKRSDEEQRPILFVYINSDILGNQFYYASKENGKFIELSQEDFTQQFECYEDDLNLSNGIRPWEAESKNNNIGLSKNSSQLVAEEGVGR